MTVLRYHHEANLADATYLVAGIRYWLGKELIASKEAGKTDDELKEIAENYVAGLLTHRADYFQYYEFEPLNQPIKEAGPHSADHIDYMLKYSFREDVDPAKREGLIARFDELLQELVDKELARHLTHEQLQEWQQLQARGETGMPDWMNANYPGWRSMIRDSMEIIIMEAIAHGGVLPESIYHLVGVDDGTK